MYSFWLNKGLDQLDWFEAFNANGRINDGGFNMLATDSEFAGGPSPATLQSTSLGNFTKQFSGAVNLTNPRNIDESVSDITPNDNTDSYNVFPADTVTSAPALHYRQMFTFLPFQVTNTKFVIATYVLGWNVYSSPPPMNFEVDVKNVDGTNATVSYYDPITDTTEPVTVVSRSATDVVLDIEALDYPRTITIDEGTNSTPPSDSTPPTSTIDNGPNALSISSGAGFTFSGQDNITPSSSLNYQCQIDSGAYSACSAPQSYSNLTIGQHTFRIKATDLAGNTQIVPTVYTWTIINPPPLIGDLDSDGHVSGSDLQIFSQYYGQNYAPAEFDGTSQVQGHDASMMLINYGK